MTDNKAPIIKPIKLKHYECKQSNHEVAPELPMRNMILAPSGSGKTVLLVNMIMDIYKGCVNIIYIFSPSVDIDHTWQPVKDYIDKKLKPNEKGNVYFDSYDPAELKPVMDKQHKAVDYLKSQGSTKMFQI